MDDATDSRQKFEDAGLLESVLEQLTDAADLTRAGAVGRFWHRVVIGREDLSGSSPLRQVPVAAAIDHENENDRAPAAAAAAAAAAKLAAGLHTAQ